MNAALDLIDTQIFIWVALDSDKLGAKARQILLAAAEVFVSAASIWEIAIKAKIGSSKEIPTNLCKQLNRVVSESL